MEKNKSLSNLVTINVGGVKFQCYEDTLKTFEDSILAKLNQSADNFNKVTNEFFFDRNPQLFNHILDSYRSGTIHIPKDTCGITFKAELEYWGLKTKYVSPCCWGALYSSEEDMETVSTLEEFYGESTGYGLCKTGDTIPLKKRIWLFLYEPKSSLYALLWAVFISLVIVTSVLVTAAESFPEAHTDTYTAAELRSMARLHALLDWKNSSEVHDILYKKPNAAIPGIDAVCFTILTIEMILLGIFCPNWAILLKSWIHIAEVICTISFWVSFSIKECIGEVESFFVLRVYILLKYITGLKLVRLFRIAKHIPAMKIMGLTLKISKQELSVMALILFILSAFFGTSVYLLELRLVEPEFDNIFSAMYWAVITLTTVGYGDYTPSSHAGQFAAVLCAVCGILMLAIPIGIIAAEFHNLYGQHKYAKKYMKDNVDTPTRNKRKTIVRESTPKKYVLFDYKKTMGETSELGPTHGVLL